MKVVHWAEWGNWTTACGVWADPPNDHTDRPHLVTCADCQFARGQR